MNQEKHRNFFPAEGQKAPASKNIIARKIIIGIPVLVALGFLLVADSYWIVGGVVDRSVKWSGIILMSICIVGRTWSSLYIGGRKNLEVIDIGPYSMMRNPLYFFSIIGAIGAGSQSGSLIVSLLAGTFTWAVFRWITLGEEDYLRAIHPDTYRQYVTRVPRFLPKISLWTSPETLVIRPKAVFSTFFDGLIFLSAIPLAELITYLHHHEILPVYFFVL
jgi:protein-S-isoprenylcysteine O-methyltransferase Ste14